MRNFDIVRNYGRRGKGYSSPDNYVIKTTKAFHLLSATAWAGGALSMQALSFLLFTTDRPETVPFIRECLFFIDTYVVIPGLAGCALTGLFYSLVTSIGFVKYTWITYKWIITCSAGFWGILFWGPWGNDWIVRLSPYGLDGPLRFIRGFMLPESWWHGALQLLVILSMCLISIYRPVSFQRKSHEHPGSGHVAPVEMLPW